MANTTLIARFLKEIDEQDLWDDRREYQEEDLQRMYGLDEEGAKLLWLNIQAKTDPSYDAYKIEKEEAPHALEFIQESLHQSLEGWGEDEKVVINAFLAEMARCIDEWE
jgi:hypothetical protein